MVESNYFQIPNDWEYKGEGNCHLVLGLPKVKKVLSIRKRNKPTTLYQWFIHFLEEYLFWFRNGDEIEEHRDLNFYTMVMKPMLGVSYVSDATQVKLSRKEVRRIESQLSSLRPVSRKHKILHYGRATLFQDYTKLQTNYFPLDLSEHTFAVEIKPKKGWIPFSEREFPKCIFCMNQILKLQTRKISRKSDYCPMDLFSGDELRMHKSILALLDNPQNNLRIFKDGRIVYEENSAKSYITQHLEDMFQYYPSDKEELLNNFASFLFQCLTRPFETEQNCSAELFCGPIVSKGYSLPKGCILEKILSVQMIDVQGTSYYNNLIKGDVPQWEYVEKILKNLDSKNCVKCSLRILSNGTSDKDFVLAQYLIAAIANDCSVMVTFRKIKTDDITEEHTNKYVVQSKLGSFLVNIGALDLYPKPMSTIKKHESRNKELLELMRF